MIWDAWENTSNITAVPPDFCFDAAQYEVELTRAAADRNWEEPVDTVARLLQQTHVDSGWFEQCGCVLTDISRHDHTSHGEFLTRHPPVLPR
ncbi:hypothetical protein YW5DRAFT_00577 [Streptomyces sp. Ncost-T6T-1]|uniref:hypothetical protein n=2 Tax=Streptomyces TaxID=1883 RepID=UPI000805CFDA|nr:hypothetical protein YW5DRAFT_00577 [Streptomyces sp. Ncost-T6T-1]